MAERDSSSTGGRWWPHTKVMGIKRALSVISRGSFAVLLCCPAAFSQEISLLLPPETAQPAPVVQALPTTPLPEVSNHKFWDRENQILFASVAAGAAADFAVTHANLQAGGKELNPVAGFFAGSTTGLAVNFAGETAGSIGLSYIFHKTGHHKLERVVSFANIGGSAVAVGYGLAHR
jgi:hypothetical protein